MPAPTMAKTPAPSPKTPEPAAPAPAKPVAPAATPVANSVTLATAEAKPVEKKPEPLKKPAETKPEAKPETKPETAGKEPTGKWVVQLGAYREAGNVKLILAKLKEMNVPAYTVKVDTPDGPRIRVRAGPFPTREAAEKAHPRVKVIGVDGPISQNK